MRDALRLRYKLAVALTCLPLSLAACEDKAKDANNAQATSQATAQATAQTTAQAAAADATQAVQPKTPNADATAAPTPPAGEAAEAKPGPPTADAIGVPEKPPEMRRPMCPNGDWETTQTEATKLAEADTHWKENKPEPKLDCPTRFNADSNTVLGKEGPPGGRSLWLNVDEAKTQAKRDAGDNEACAYRWVEPCPGGRILVDGAEHRVAEMREGHAWLSQAAQDAQLQAAVDTLPDALRRNIAQAWLDDARIEHASVASFSRATLELMLHGAPPELLAATTRSAGEEVRHARDAFALAALYGAQALEPGTLDAPDVRRGTLAELAVETFIEGCVGETVATLATTRAHQHCTLNAVKRVLQTIIDEESEHAALAWSTVSWALNTGGAPVREALIEAATRLRQDAFSDALKTHALSESELSTLRAHGRLDPHAQHKALHDAWRIIINPMLEELLAS